MNNAFDVIIIGGSYAGLSAALALGRSLKNTLIIDIGNPCNHQTPHSHNFLTRDGQKPGKIATVAKEQVAQYESITFYTGFASFARTIADGFEVQTHTTDTFFGKKLIFATGITDEMPDIPGFAECWGISVIHCPYCHGYEFRHQKTGILASGERAYHLTSLVHNLTDEIVILTNGKADFTPEQITKIDSYNIRVEEAEVEEVKHENGYLKQLIMKNGDRLELDALYAGLSFRQHSDLPASLGCTFTEQGHISVDAFQETNIPGIYACGDNCSPMRSIAHAVSAGNIAGAMANMRLTNEHF